MAISKKLMYLAFGGFMALTLAFGAYTTFAQADEGSDVEGDPGIGLQEGRGDREGFGRDRSESNKAEELAEALGMTVEEVEAAFAAVRVAVIEQAVADGEMTQEEADAILSGENGGRGNRGRIGGHDNVDLLAEELGVTVEELEAAQEEIKAARLAEKVESGELTQEEADYIQAKHVVRDYIEADEASEVDEAAIEAGIADALADGAITQDQADQMLEDLENGEFGKGGRRGGSHGGKRGMGQGRGNSDAVEGQDA